MAKIEIKIPAMGEGITDATITKWLVEPGQAVEEEDSLVEIATDKVDTEIQAPGGGKVIEILKQENDVAAVGETILMLEMEIEAEVGDDFQIDDFQEEDSKEPAVAQKKVNLNPDILQDRFVPPFIRDLAKEYDISLGELYTIEGSGKDGDILKEDIIVYAKQQQLKRRSTSDSSGFQVNPLTTSSVEYQEALDDNSEIIEMNRMRKLIAEHMVRSKNISPHVTQFIEADVTNLVNWRNGIKDEFLKREGQKITFTPIFVETVVNALKKFPMINASVIDDKIILKRDINIGLATALKDGNLIVPVIRNADKKNLSGLAKSVNDIVHRARENKLDPQEVKGGTFTITNLGTFESTAGTPIINQPEVAILAVGAITRKPAVVKTEYGESIGIRDILVLSLAYDHRIIDGFLGGMFLKYIRDMLQEFDHERSIF